MSLARLAGRARDSWLECLGAPLWLISTQQGAVCPSAYGEDPTGDSWPEKLSRYADTVPRPAPLCALLTNSGAALAGGNSAPSWPRPCPVKGEPLAASSWPPGSTTKLSICEVPVRADEVVAGGVEEHVAQAGVIWHGDRRAGDRGQAAIEMQAEAGVAAAVGAGVRFASPIRKIWGHGDFATCSRASRLTRSPGVRVMPGSASRRARLSMTVTGIHSCGQVTSPSVRPAAGEPAGMVISRIW